MAAYKRVSWQQNGKQVDIDISHGGTFTLYINGKCNCTQGKILPPAAKDRILYAQRGAVGTIGPVVIYQERADELEALQKEAKAAPKSCNPLADFLALEAAVFAAERVVQEHYDNPAYGYQQLEAAKVALQSWIDALPEHRAAYEAEVAQRREAEAKRRQMDGDIWNY